MLSERAQRQVDRFLDAAEEAMSQFDWSAVRENALAVLRLDPDNADAQAFLAAAERDTDGPPQSRGIPGDAPSSRQESSPANPISLCEGRYQVKRFLGEGAKKRVYLAHDTKLDRDVAFALIKTDGLDAEGQARIRREAQAMGRLGDHPHIVAVFDIGEESLAHPELVEGRGGSTGSPRAAQGQPYLVSQLMPGGDVAGLIERAENHRVPLDVALKIAGEVCRALEHAHSHGIVHRDLKPGNVWLTADPSTGSGGAVAKLGDFGLALAVDRSRLTQAGMMVGTVHYMPPEQALGGEVTARSDLYSLGAMLYEMATGRPPFVGDESVAIITQHLNTPPVAPSWHAPDVPTGIEALILRLLEKDPNRRPGSAAEVRAMLASIAGDGDRGLGIGKGSQPPTPNPQSLTPNPLYRRTFVGREAELRQLEAAFDGALSGRGALVTLVGEPGIGKTALCEQLATYVAVRSGKALVGHCYEEGSFSLPFLAFVEAMRSYVLARDPEGLKEDLGSGAADVARIVSEIRDRFPPDASNPQSALRDPQSTDPDADRWLAERNRGSGPIMRSLATGVLLATLDGDLEGAVGLTEALVARAEEMGMGVNGKQEAYRAAMRPLLLLGRATEALDKQLMWRDLGGRGFPGIPLCLAHLGRHDEARAQLAEEWGESTRDDGSPDAPTTALILFLETTVLLGERETANRIARRLEPVSHFIYAGYDGTCVARHLGAAAALLGDRAGARARYAQTLEVAERVRHRPEIALTHLALAELLLDDALTPPIAPRERGSESAARTTLSQREREHQRAEAQRHLDFAITEFQAMKMQPSLDRALRHKGLLRT